MSSIIDRVNATPLDLDLIKGLLTCVAEMPAEDRRDMTARNAGLIRFLEENLGRQDARARESVLISFEFRMDALLRLREHPEYNEWVATTTTQGEPDLISEVMIAMAASEPLIERNQRPAFEASSFFRKTLEHADVEGRG